MTLVVKLNVNGEDIDKVTSYSKIILDGFEMCKVLGGQIDNDNPATWEL